MNWLPIEEYDKLKKKPENVVFLVSATPKGRNHLPRRVTLERRCGFRTTTHYCILPPLPPQIQEEQ